MSFDVSLTDSSPQPAAGSLGEELALDMAAAIEGYEQSFFWRSAEYPCVIASGKDTLIVAKSLFVNAQYPPRGDSILVAGQNRQVVKLNNSALKFSVDGLVEDKPFVDDPTDPALLVEFGRIITGL